MNRAQDWEEELTRRFPSIDCDGLPETAEFIAILEEMNGFDKGANLQYNILTHDISIVSEKCRITPVYIGNQISGFRCIFFSSSPLCPDTMTIQPNSYDIRKFLLEYWPELFPKESI